MCAAIYYNLKHPDVHRKLCAELHGANLALPRSTMEGDPGPPIPQYLQAVMREAMRMHPGVGLILERVVPKEVSISPMSALCLRGLWSEC